MRMKIFTRNYNRIIFIFIFLLGDLKAGEKADYSGMCLEKLHVKLFTRVQPSDHIQYY